MTSAEQMRKILFKLRWRELSGERLGDEADGYLILNTNLIIRPNASHHQCNY